MMAPAPPGHSQHQQPISSPNRTSRDSPPLPDPTEIETHKQAYHPVLGMQLPEQSRARSRGHRRLDFHGPPTKSPVGLPAASFANRTPPASAGPMSIDGGLCGVGHSNLQLNLTPFGFVVPGTIISATDGTIRHHSRLPYAPTDADFAYGSNLVSPSGIHSSRGHYDGGFPGHWDDTVSHGASTQKVSCLLGTSRIILGLS
ncbi:hypothetical protein FALCPG4_015446 [Fusarium falciforme]